MVFDVIGLIKSVGYLGVFSIIFTETGILFGVLLPGDTLLFAVGVLAGQGLFNIWYMVAGCFVAAFVGNLVGYELGKRYGLPFVKKYASKFITDDHLEKTGHFFEKYGNFGIVIARFVPVARTVAPFLAGVIRMDYRDYVIYSLIGAIVWAVGLPVAGYFLGHMIPPEAIDMLLLPVLAIIILIVAWPYLTKFLVKK
jgi:membrane-associated protein